MGKKILEYKDRKFNEKKVKNAKKSTFLSKRALIKKINYKTYFLIILEEAVLPLMVVLTI